MIKCFEDFVRERSFGEKTEDDVSRNTYKYTDCGAWIEFDEKSVTLGSIVEGVDEGVSPVVLNYPFALDDFWKMLDSVEEEADRIWNLSHGCNSCDTDEGIYGMKPVDPECNRCEGLGIII